MSAMMGDLVFDNGEWFVFRSHKTHSDDLEHTYHNAVGKASNGKWYRGMTVGGLQHRIKKMGKAASLEEFLSANDMWLEEHKP